MYTVSKLEKARTYISSAGHKIKNCNHYAVVFRHTSTIEVQLVPSRAWGPPDVETPLIYEDRMAAQRMADELNGVVVEFPKVHARALRAAFKGRESTWNPGFYYVNNETTSEYLFRRLGIRGTEWHEYNIMDTFKVALCWRMQKWVVNA